MKQDFISRSMDEFTRTLGHIAELKKQERWEEVIKIIGVNLNRLVKTSPEEFCRLTEVGLFAQLIKDGPTVWVPYKKIMLIVLLKETGDYATRQDAPRAGRGWYLKALHLLLDSLAHDEIREYVEIVPKVEVLLSALEGFPLPVRTRLLLMREYERRGCFGQVRDEFQAARQRAPKNSRLLSFGIAFFERLGRESDATLAAGKLQRWELEASMDELLGERERFEMT